MYQAGHLLGGGVPKPVIVSDRISTDSLILPIREESSTQENETTPGQKPISSTANISQLAENSTVPLFPYDLPKSRLSHSQVNSVNHLNRVPMSATRPYEPAPFAGARRINSAIVAKTRIDPDQVEEKFSTTI